MGPRPPEDAMKTLSRSVAKLTGSIVAVLSCFDRVIFQGHLPTSNRPTLEGFVDHFLEIRRCDFVAFAQQQSETLVDRARPASGRGGRRRVPLSRGVPSRGQARRRDPAPAIRPRRGPGRRLRLHGVLPELRAHLWPGPPAPRHCAAAAARPVLLLPGSSTGPDLHPPDDLVPVHDPGLCQWPLLAGPGDARAPAGVPPPGQRLHGPGRPRSGAGAGRSVRRAEVDQDPRSPGSSGEPPDVRAVVPRPVLLLGRRSSRVRHRPDRHRPRGVGRPRSAAAGPHRGQLLGAGHPGFPGATLPSPVRWRGADGLPEGASSRCADQASGEEQLAEDVRQVRLGAADRGGDQRPAGVPRATAADSRHSAGDGVVPDDQGGGQPLPLSRGGAGVQSAVPRRAGGGG